MSAIVTVIDFRLPFPKSKYLKGGEILVGHSADCHIVLPEPIGGQVGGVLARISMCTNGIDFCIRPLRCPWAHLPEPSIIVNYNFSVAPWVSKIIANTGDVVYVHYNSPYFFGFQLILKGSGATTPPLPMPSIEPTEIFDFKRLPEQAKLKVFSNFDAHELLHIIAPVCLEFFNLVTKYPAKLWRDVTDLDEGLYGDAVANACHLAKDQAVSMNFMFSMSTVLPPWAFAEVNSGKLKDVSLWFHNAHARSSLPTSVLPMISRSKDSIERLRMVNFKEHLRSGFSFDPLSKMKHLCLKLDRDHLLELLEMFGGMIGFGMDPGNVGGGLETSEVSLLGIFAGMPELNYLYLGYGFGLDTRMWNGQDLPAFSTIRFFCYRENVFAGSVHSPFRHMKNLTRLRAPVNSQMDVIAELRQLKVLWLDGPYQVTYELEGFFARLKSTLTVLQVSDSATFTNNCLANLGQNQTQLQALILDTCREITDAGLAAVITMCPAVRILEVTGTVGLEGTGWLEIVTRKAADFLYARVGRVVDFRNANDLFVLDEAMATALQADAVVGGMLTNKLQIADSARRKYKDCWVEDFEPVFFLPELLESYEQS